MVARSPNYPAIDLASALASIEKAFKAENRNKMSRLVLAKHLGYNSLNGRSLGQIGAVRAYGLIDGRGEELRISDDAVTALMAPGGSAERKAALERLAVEPALFKQLRSDFPDTLPSEENIKFQLVKRGFTADAAGKAAKNYLKTMQLVSENPEAYYPSGEAEEPEMDTQPIETARHSQRPMASSIAPRSGTLQEVFNLEEGPVTLSFPANLSPTSYQDLEDYLSLFLRKAKRKADSLRQVAEEMNDPDFVPRG